MATFYTHKPSLFKKGTGSLHEAMKQAMDKDTIVINQSKISLDNTLELKTGVTICGDENKPAPVIVCKERTAAMFVGANKSGIITLKHVKLQLDNSSNGLSVNSKNVKVILDDVQIYHTNKIETPYTGVILNSDGGSSIEIRNSLIDTIKVYVDSVIIENSNIGNWFDQDYSQMISNRIMMSDSAIQNTVVSGIDRNSQIQGSNLVLGGNVKFDKSTCMLNNITLSQLPVINNRNKNTRLPDGTDATSLMVGSDAKVTVNKFNVAVDDTVSNKLNLALPEWRSLAIKGSLSLNDGMILNTGLKNILKDGDVLFENVNDDSQWQVLGKPTTANRNSKSELFNAQSKLNLNTEASGIVQTKSALDQLNEMIGLESVKKRVNEIVSQAKINAERERRGLSNSDKDTYLHMVFAGNAGTGKTTVARLVGQALYEAGVLKSTRFVEAGQRDFVGTHVGETKPKTHAKIQEALDGVLFIDEAYSLAPPKAGGNTYNDEAVEELVQSITQYGGRLLVIMAGYTTDMQDFFRRGNEGLTSRFSNWIEFPDYTITELKQIERLHLRQSHARLASASVMQDLDKGIDTLLPFVSRMRGGGNGRFVANYVQKVTEMRDARLAQQNISNLTDEQLMIITPADVTKAVADMKFQFTNRQA